MLGNGALGQLALGQFPSLLVPPPPFPPPPVVAFAGRIGELVLEAYQLIQVRPESLHQEHLVTAQHELNYMFAQWSNLQINLWKVVRTQVSLVAGVATYQLPLETVLATDVSVVMNFGTQQESRRYITPISRTEYHTYVNQQIADIPAVYWFNRQISPTITLFPVPKASNLTLDYFAVNQINAGQAI
jgi:hypothetical protein